MHMSPARSLQCVRYLPDYLLHYFLPICCLNLTLILGPGAGG